jgi:hypothetical protein
MANEINLQVNLSANKNGALISQNLQKQADMAGDEMVQVVQIIGTSAEALSVIDVTTIGYVLVKNLDTTNYVELSTDNANANKFAKLLPGDLTLIKAASATIYATANTASCKMLVIAIEL